MKVLDMLKKISYSLFANVISSFVSFFAILVIPKMFEMDITQFSNFQLFMFYISYIGFFHFGICDGIYLREGGKQYSHLNKKTYTSQFIVFILLLLLFSFIISLGINGFVNQSDHRFVLQMTIVNMVIYLPQLMFLILLQATGRIKEYSILIISNRFIFLLGVIISIILGIQNYKFIIASYNASFAITLILVLWIGRSIFDFRNFSFVNGLRELLKNAYVGSRLMLSNVLSLLSFGVARYSVKLNWGLAIFGEISFALSLTNIILVLIEAISIAIYPGLRNIEKSTLVSNYLSLNYFVTSLLFIFLVIYFPMNSFMNFWLPNYRLTFEYLKLLFPVVIFTSKMGLITNTYLKVFRFENDIFYVNLLIFIISSILTVLLTIFTRNISYIIALLIFNTIFKSFLLEFILRKRMNMRVGQSIFSELYVTVLFVASTRFDLLISLIIYCTGLVLLFIFDKKRTSLSVNYLRSLFITSH